MNNKYITIALGISILVNAFLCGFALSHHIDKEHLPFMGGDHRGPPPMEDMILHMVKSQSEKLSPEGRKTVMSIADKYQTIIRKSDMSHMEHIFTDIQKAMTADTFDKAKVESLHKQLNLTEINMKDAIGNMMVDIASHLSNSDRVAFFTDLFPPPPPDFPHDAPPYRDHPENYEE